MNIKEIAEKAHVAKSTVSNVLNNKKNVSPKTTEKILKICEEYNYRPNFYSKNLSSSKKNKIKTNIIGLFLASSSKGAFKNFYSNLIKGVAVQLRKRGHDLLIYYDHSEEEIEMKLSSGYSPIDGAIILTPKVIDMRVFALKEKFIPFISIGTTGYDTIPSIDVDNKNLVKAATSQMIRKGFENVYLINSNKLLTISKDRADGFNDTYWEMHIDKPHGILFYEGNEEEAISYINKAIKNGAKGFICADSELSLLVYKECMKNKLNIGTDIAVFCLGYPSIPLDQFNPPLSYASQDYEIIGQEAAKLIIDLLEKKKVSNKLIDYKMYNNESFK